MRHRRPARPHVARPPARRASPTALCPARAAERYNKKFPDTPLDDEELVLAVKDDSPFTNRSLKHLTSSDTPGNSFAAGMEVRATRAAAAASARADR